MSTDEELVICREVVRNRVRYRDAAGRVVRDSTVIARITSLAIPPAWTDVRICPDPDGKIQAVGRDAAARKQYRYHPDYRAKREAAKYASLHAFGSALPKLRRRVDADLRRPGLDRDKVLAAVVRLLDRTHLRVGNAEYVRKNHSHGLSTLFDEHVSFRGASVRLRFRGKSGVWHDRKVTDARLAKVVRRCRDLPGDDLFQYRDDAGVQHVVRSGDVNAYIRAATGDHTAKSFRTWAGSVRALGLLSAEEPPASKAAGNRAVVKTVKAVAAELGNTPAVCRKSYVHPVVVRAFLKGELSSRDATGSVRGLSADENRLLGLLGARMRRPSRTHRVPPS